ncbi:MAG: nucleoside deaminase [Wenzhouxiangellaceae bacterium]|nr:nucleoside deaminase [Wenzhouxiangellaceae bacterium]
MRLQSSFRIALPDWCADYAAGLPERLPDPADRMAVAVELSQRNVEAGTGGPFGAVVSAVADGTIVALGVNRVESDRCSSAHAEIVALSLAQAGLATWNLGEVDIAPLELASSCEPCAMCLGAIPWSGIRRLICGATREDAEATGFDEGERPGDWIGTLERRGIEVFRKVLRERAAGVLREYRERGATIYNP